MSDNLHYKTAVITYVYLWQVEHFKDFDSSLSFSEQQDQQLNTLTRFIEGKETNEDRLRVDLDQLKLCYEALEYALSKNDVLDDKEFPFGRDKVDSIISVQPKGLIKPFEKLSFEEFLQHSYHIAAYQLFESYGDAIQKLISSFEVVSLTRSLNESFHEYQKESLGCD